MQIEITNVAKIQISIHIVFVAKVMLGDLFGVAKIFVIID